MKKLINRTTYFLTILCMLSSIATMKAQMVNAGEMTIMPNTEVGLVSDFENTSTANLFNDGDLYIYGNLQNDGILAYANTGLIRFVGSAQQILSGTQEVLFYNTLFSNTSSNQPFQLSGLFTVENSSDFANGIVNNRDFGGVFTFGTIGNHTSTSDGSHLNGQVVKLGNTAFEFPIGNGGFYRPSAISAPENVADDFRSVYVFENSNTVSTPHDLKSDIIDRIDDTEYWRIERNTGSSEVFITLSWNTNTTPDFIANAPDPNVIHVVRWDAVNNFWIDEGGIVDAANQTVTTIAQVSEYGIYTLATIRPELELPDDLFIYNALTPNGDGLNDIFRIDDIERYPNNTVRVFNRLGVEVYNAKGYDNNTTAFRGISEGRLTISSGRKLPTGTYFYVLEYEFPGSSTTPAQKVRKVGYLYINTED